MKSLPPSTARSSRRHPCAVVATLLALASLTACADFVPPDGADAGAVKAPAVPDMACEPSSPAFIERSPGEFDVVDLRPTPTPSPSACNECAGVQQARIVPAFRDGVAIGFKLVRIQPCSFYAQAGIRSGDVIVRVNDRALTSPEIALDVWASLRTAPLFRVDLERDGRLVSLRYHVVTQVRRAHSRSRERSPAGPAAPGRTGR